MWGIIVFFYICKGARCWACAADDRIAVDTAKKGELQFFASAGFLALFRSSRSGGVILG